MNKLIYTNDFQKVKYYVSILDAKYIQSKTGLSKDRVSKLKDNLKLNIEWKTIERILSISDDLDYEWKYNLERLIFNQSDEDFKKWMNDRPDWENKIILTIKTQEDLLLFCSFLKTFKINPLLVNRIESFAVLPKKNEFIEKIFTHLYPEDTVSLEYRLKESLLLTRTLFLQLEQCPNRNNSLEDQTEDNYEDAGCVVGSQNILETFKDTDYYMSIAGYDNQEFKHRSDILSNLKGVDNRLLITYMILSQYNLFLKEDEFEFDEEGHEIGTNLIYDEIYSFGILKSVLSKELINSLINVGFYEDRSHLFLDFNKV